MFRKFTSIALLASIFAVGSSGLLMIILNDFAFQLQMHPVHKVFGIIMCIFGSFHIYYNLKAIKSYLKVKGITIAGTILFLLLILLFVIGMNKPIDKEIVSEIEKKMSQLEQNE